MSQLPLTHMEYATVVPSGERLGDVSSPAASLTRVKWSKRASALSRVVRGIHDAAAASTAVAATTHGSHTGIAGRRDSGSATAVAARPGADENVSSAKARSLAD